MRLGLGLSLANVRRVVTHHPSAVLYFGGVQTALGSTIGAALPNASRDPKAIISDWFEAEEVAGRLASLKRLWLPIYANAAANAIDLTTCAVGSFTASGVTHGAGFVQSNGTSGYFRSVTNWQSLMSQTSGTIGTLNYTQNPTANLTSIGIGPTGGTSMSCGSQNAGILPASNWAGAGITRGAVGTSGIQAVSRLAGQTRMIRRSSAGITEDSNSLATSATVSNGEIFVMARNSGGSPVQITTAQIGAAFIGDGMTSLELADFSLNLKTLWENLTGLTLP